MPSIADWKVPPSIQPRPDDYNFDLEQALSAIVGLHAIVPTDAFSASSLGVERAGNGVLIGDGLILTIGYLITEAETIWLHLGNGRIVPGHALAFDSETGFGLVQALDRIDLEPLPLGSSAEAQIGDRIIVGGVGGRTRSLAGRIAGKQEFAGYWEYALDEAIFTLPSHPNWGGTGLISASGELLGIVHYLFHRSTTAIQPSCYLQDLFTLSAARGKGVGRALIDGVYERARLAGAPRVYWLTHETNHTAMQLYDKVAERSGFVVYRKML